MVELLSNMAMRFRSGGRGRGLALYCAGAACTQPLAKDHPDSQNKTLTDALNELGVVVHFFVIAGVRKEC